MHSIPEGVRFGYQIKRTEMRPKTRIINTLNGNHTIVLEIGDQSFEMKEYLGDSIMTSEQRAKWFKKQLDHALGKIK